MRHLKPITILILGSLLLGAACAIAIGMSDPIAHAHNSAYLNFAIGTVFGFFFFAPITIAEAYREKLLTMLQPHQYQIKYWISSLMMICVGYSFASIRHHTFDVLSAVAVVLFFLCGFAAAILGIIWQPRSGSAA